MSCRQAYARAQLPTGDEIVTPIGHGRITISCEKDSIAGQFEKVYQRGTYRGLGEEEISLPPKWRGVRFEINPLLGTVKGSST